MLSPSKKRKRSKRHFTPRPATAEAFAHSIDEFVARARVSRPTVYRMINDGELRSIRVRGRRLIPCTEYARLGYVEAQPTSEVSR